MRPQDRAEAAVSLSDELTVIERAVGGARQLIEQDRLDAGSCGAASAGAEAILSLVGCRARSLGRAVRRSVNPAELLADHNSVPLRRGDGEDPDIRLAPWTPKEEAARGNAGRRASRARRRPAVRR